MLQKFKEYIETHQLVGNQEKILLGVSGGIDSVGLVHLFEESKISFAIAHCNFQLRGDDARGDQAFVRELAEKYKVPFHTVNFDTQFESEERAISTQMTARELRYDWFEEIMQLHGYHKLAVAHHLNDSLETTLFNLTKGTGIAGLRGIKPKNDWVIRPLLFAVKEEIIRYVVDNQLVWREDKSNQSEKYHRNYIRHNVVPALSKINPSLDVNFHETMDRLSVVERIYLDRISSLKKQYLKSEGNCYRLDLNFINHNEDYILVYELIKPFEFSLRQAKNILKNDGISGANFYSKNYWIVKGRGELVITKKEETEESFLLHENTSELKIGINKIKAKEVKLPKELKTKNEIAYLDYNKLEFPLKLRDWQVGEKFSPLGMKGKKKISDFMIDHKIPVNLKKSYKVLVSGNDIVWLVGLRVDNRFKITDKTTKVYQLEIVKENVETL